MSSEQAQRDVYDFCQSLKTKTEILYQPGSIFCWIDDFKDWLGGNFPVPEDQFIDKLLEFSTNSEEGKVHKEKSNIAFIDNKLVYMQFTAKSTGGLYSPYFEKNPIKMSWDDQLDNFSQSAAIGVRNVKQTAGLDWCYMITELQLVITMKNSLWMSIVFALFALFFAT